MADECLGIPYVEKMLRNSEEFVFEIPSGVKEIVLGTFTEYKESMEELILKFFKTVERKDWGEINAEAIIDRQRKIRFLVFHFRGKCVVLTQIPSSNKKQKDKKGR